LLLLWQKGTGQPAGLNFVNFSSINGLSSNTVNYILKDRLGYMWFATEDGLNRFDGTSFKVYNHTVKDTNSIATNQIRVLYEDAQGNLWVGTNRALSVYDRQKDCFHNYPITSGTAVLTICSDGAGRLWVGSYAGLVLFDPASRQVKDYTAHSARAGGLLSNTVTCVFRDSQKRLWAGTDKGLYLCQAGADSFTRFSIAATERGAVSDSFVRVITEDRNGRLWVGTNNGGLNMLQADGKHFKNFSYSSTNAHTLSSNLIYCVAPDATGKLWVGTEDGLNIFDPQTGLAQRVKSDDRNKYSFKGRSVLSLFIDGHGLYWVGTNQDGINKYDQNLAFFNIAQYSPFDPQGLSSPKITSFAEGVRGEIYVGTDGGGLNLFNRETGLFKHVLLAGKSPAAVPAILALERRNNELWVGTFHQGVYVLDIRSGAVKHYSAGNGPRDLPSGDIFCIKKDRQGNIWLGTNGRGVCMYEPRSGIFYRIGEMVKERNGRNRLLSDGFIRAIEQDSAGNMVIGTVGAGVALYNPVQRTCRVFNRGNTDLPLDEAISLHIDRKGVIWAGTTSGGLCRLDYIHNRFINYAEQQGLANMVIYKILEDEAGKLWVSTNKGLSCLDPATSTFKNYSSQNGLQPSSFHLGAGLKESSGLLFFGGMEGFNYFRPGALRDNMHVPAVVFTGLKIGGHTVVPGAGSAIQQDISIAGEIRLDYKQNFSVDFTALDYTTPGENRYMYRLDGFDKDWNDIGTARTAVFTNLYPRNYILEVRAKNSNGAWITQPATIRIYVSPPFWMTGYAYAAYILIGAFVLWVIRYRGIQKLKNRFALEQERLRMKQLMEQERREAERLHEFDQLKIKFLTNLSHEFRTPLSLIMGPIENLHDTETDWQKRELLGMVKRNGRRLLNLVNQLVDFRKLADREMKLHCTPGDLVAFLKEAAESFKDIAERKQILFTCTTELACFYTLFDRDKMERILFNLLGNAFKFTGNNGKVSLEIKQAHPSGELLMIVTDTGCGISIDNQQRVFDRFFQGDAHTGVLNQGSGIGLSIARDFVQLHGGTIAVESEPGKGCIFTVRLPLQVIRDGVHETLTPEDTPAGETSLTAIQPGAPPADRLTVLLIEDNEDFRTYLGNNLRPFYTIIEAADGKDGWQKALSQHPDIIVSDITMPNMDGIELSRKIRADKRTSHIPIILLTALTAEAHQLRGLETGASDYLTKPFSFDILKVKIRNLVMLNQRLRQTYTRRLHIETPVTAVQSEDEKLLLSITRYIELNLDSVNLSVEDLCKHVYMSHASLYRKIVELTGETPVEFIRSIKLNKAADLLEKSDKKISEISYTVGFTTPNYFTRAFKAKFHLSPSEYIALKRKKMGVKVENAPGDLSRPVMEE
jgi:signal transduction histidine kinase/ligand-binding sensor domain-containing protein/DNA-binding response OmpR family regulator